MKKQMLTVVGLVILLAPGMLLSQDGARNDLDNMEIKIFHLRYLAAHDACNILDALCAEDDTRIILDENTNRLILRATRERMQTLTSLLAELDVQTDTRSASQSEPLLCRVYMVELPAPQQPDLQSFHLELRVGPPGVSLPDLLKASEDKKIKIDAFRGDEPDADGMQQFEIEGRTASAELITQMLDVLDIPTDGIVKMELDEMTSDIVVPGAQISQLPEQLRQHIQKFLGADVQTVGYWFGNMSSPGQIEAPIGPWSIQLEVKPTQTTALAIEVEVGEWRW